MRVSALQGVALTVVFAAVYAAALLTSVAPALRASRIHRVQALRYE